jgi:hypothetical protein
LFDMQLYRGCIEALAADPGIDLLAISQDCPEGLGTKQAALYRPIADTIAETRAMLGRIAT